MIHHVRALAAAVAIAALGFGLASAETADPIAGGKLAEAIVFQNKLWLRGALESSTTGALVSIDLATGKRTVMFDEGVIDMDASDGNLWVLRQTAETVHNYNLLEWGDGGFEGMGNTGTDAPQPIGIAASSRQVVLLTPVSVFTFDKRLKRWGGFHLKGVLRYGATFSVAMPKNGDALYFGANPIPAAGESEGSDTAPAQNNGRPASVLQRIDLLSGSVTDIEKMRSSNPCDGPLSGECSTVTAIVPDANNGGCVIVALGFVRGEVSDGRVLRVCRDNVNILLEEKAAHQVADAPVTLTEPIWGLSATPDGFYAVGQSALYRFRGDAHTQEPLPAATAPGDTPGAGVVVLPTAVTSAQSVSGYKMLVAGEGP